MVEVDAEVVTGEAFALPVLVGGVSRQWSDDGDPVFAFGPLQVDQGCVAAVDQVPVRSQAPVLQSGVDAGQDFGVGAGGRHGGHVRDHVGPVAGAGLGHVREEPLPAGELSPARVTGRQAGGGPLYRWC